MQRPFPIPDSLDKSFGLSLVPGEQIRKSEP